MAVELKPEPEQTSETNETSDSKEETNAPVDQAVSEGQEGLEKMEVDVAKAEKLLKENKDKDKICGIVCTISFERPVKYLCDAWHVFPPKYEAWTHFNN